MPSAAAVALGAVAAEQPLPWRLRRVQSLGGLRRFLGDRLGRTFLAAFQIVDQFLSTLIAIFRRFGQRLHDDFAQHGMNLAD